MKLPRRQFLHLAAGAVALPAVSRFAWAQTYPMRPVHMIVGFPAGNASDIVARLIGQSLSERLGQQFVVENRPGAGGSIGTEVVVKAEPDGYTLLMSVVTANAINATLYANLNYNFIRDIAPVASIGSGSYVMVVNPSVPAKTVPEFINYAKANPGKLNMASAGNGTPTHVFGELFKMMAGVDLLHVPYRGSFMPESARWTGASRIWSNLSVDRAYSIWQTASTCSHHRDASGGVAGRSDHDRIRAGLRGERLVWGRRAKENTHRDHRQAQQGDQRDSLRSQDERAAS